MRISCHISHEQFSPRELVTLACVAEKAGFDAVFASDHVNPWTRAQGHSGFVWSWLGAALQATEKLDFSWITVPSGFRYHPSIVAQAIGTLTELFPRRVPWVAMGSGEALNETVVGQPWPEISVRNQRLREAVEIIRELLAGRCVTREGLIPVCNARVWSRGEHVPAIVGAAMTESTARWAGEWADGLLTLGTNLKQLEGLTAAFRSSAADKPVHAKVDLSWAPDESTAERQAYEQWHVHAVAREQLHELRTPEAMERAAEAVSARSIRDIVLVSADLDRHVEWLRERAALGLASIDLHNVGRNALEFITTFGRYVLPKIR